MTFFANVPKEIEDYEVEDATHKLECSHQINPRNRNEYFMPCVILKRLPDNRVKILVFGDRRIKIELCRDKKRIRYVHDHRVTQMDTKE